MKGLTSLTSFDSGLIDELTARGKLTNMSVTEPNAARLPFSLNALSP